MRSTDTGGAEFDGLATELASQNWANFALLGTRMEALEDGHSEEQTKPPSKEAQAHLDTAVARCSKLCSDVRSACQGLSSAVQSARGSGQSVGSTMTNQISEGLDKCDNMETAVITKLNSLRCRALFSATDMTIKAELRKVGEPFADLERALTSLKALNNKTKTEMKEKEVKEEKKKDSELFC